MLAREVSEVAGHGVEQPSVRSTRTDGRAGHEGAYQEAMDDSFRCGSETGFSQLLGSLETWGRAAPQPGEAEQLGFEWAPGPCLEQVFPAFMLRLNRRVMPQIAIKFFPPRTRRKIA